MDKSIADARKLFEANILTAVIKKLRGEDYLVFVTNDAEFYNGVCYRMGYVLAHSRRWWKLLKISVDMNRFRLEFFIESWDDLKTKEKIGGTVVLAALDLAHPKSLTRQKLRDTIKLAHTRWRERRPIEIRERARWNA